jgi:hypothetical protein
MLITEIMMLDIERSKESLAIVFRSLQQMVLEPYNAPFAGLSPI